MKKIRLILLLSSTIFLVFSCSSLPFPSTAKQGLLVVGCQIDSTFNRGGARIEKIDLEMTRKGDERGTTYTLTMRPNKDYGTATLEPGEYTIRQAVVHCADAKNSQNTWKDTHGTYLSFYMEKRIIFLLNKGTYLKSYSHGNGYMFSFSGANSFEHRKRILQQMEKDPRWPAWSRYQLVGFPEEKKVLPQGTSQPEG